MAGFWPAMRPSSSMAASRSLMFWVASPTPMLTTIFWSRGTAITFGYFRSFISRGTISLTYVSLIRALISASALTCPGPRRPSADPHLAPVGASILLPMRVALVVLGGHDHHVRDVDRRLALGDAALDVALRVGPGVPLDEAHALDDHAVLLADRPSGSCPRLPASLPAITSTRSLLPEPRSASGSRASAMA